MPGERLSIEARAEQIADASTNIAVVGNPHGRHAAVKAEALKHLRDVYAIASGDTFYADTALANQQ